MAPPAADPPVTLPADFPPAKRINIDVDNGPLDDALRPLRAALPAEVLLQVEDPSRRVTLHAQDVAYWEALRTLLSQGHGRPTRFTLGTERYRRQFSGRWLVAGPFLVIATRVHHDATYARPEDDVERCYVDLAVIGDPGVQLAGAEAVVVPAKALDEEGNSLVTDAPPPKPSGSDDPMRPGARVELALRPPLVAQEGKQLGHRIALVEGEIPVQIIRRMETLEFNGTETREQTIGGITVKVRVEEAEHFYNVFVDFLAGDASAEEWAAWTRRLGGTVVGASDGAGKPMDVGSWSTPNFNVPRRAHLQRQFGKAGHTGPFKATVQVPATTEEVRVPFRFQDLPLP
jgi:hypothetical protein